MIYKKALKREGISQRLGKIKISLWENSYYRWLSAWDSAQDHNIESPYTLRCHQTWRAAKWTIEISDFPSNFNLHSGGFSSHVDIRGYLGLWMVPFLTTRRSAKRRSTEEWPTAHTQELPRHLSAHWWDLVEPIRPGHPSGFGCEQIIEVS